MHLIEITTVEPSNRVYTLPEHLLPTFNDIEKFVRNAYGKDANTFDIHVHYDNVCNGYSEVEYYVYKGLVETDWHWRGVDNKPVRYHVCFAHKAQIPPTPTSNVSPSAPQTRPTTAQSGLDTETEVVNNSLDEDSRGENIGAGQGPRDQSALDISTSLLTEKDLGMSGTRRPGEHDFPGRHAKKQKVSSIRQLLRSRPTDIGPPSLALPILPPLTVSNLRANSGASNLTDPNLPDPNSRTTPDLPDDPSFPQPPPGGTYDHPWIVSSRESSCGPSVPTTGNPRNHPGPIEKKEPGQAVDPHKPLYEFLCTKRLPKGKFVVGILNREEIPSNRLPSDGRLNVVAACLQKTVRHSYSLYYTVLDQDPLGQPLENLFGRRRISSPKVDYFPQIKSTGAGDHEYLRWFMINYRRKLSNGLSYQAASVVDLTEESDSEGENYEERFITRIITLKVPKGFLAKIEKADIFGRPMSSYQKPADESNTTPDHVAQCSRCLKNGDICRPSKVVGVTACYLCCANKQECSLAKTPTTVKGNKSLAQELFPSDEATSNRPSSIPANDHESSARQPSAPEESQDESREDDQRGRLSITKNREEGDQSLPTTANDRESSSRQPSVPEEAQDATGEKDVRPNLSDDEGRQEGGSCADSPPESTMVRLNIVFTDKVKNRDYSSLLSFEKREVPVPCTEKASHLTERLRGHIKAEATNKSDLTDLHLKDLLEADLVVKNLAPGAEEGLWPSRKERRRLFIKSWDSFQWNDFTGPLTGHAGETMNLSVEMFKGGSHGMPSRGLGMMSTLSGKP